MVNKAIRVARARAPVRLAIYVSIARAYVTHELAVSSTHALVV